MNARLGNKAIEIARALRVEKISGKSFHVSFLARKNRIVCMGWNDYNKHHPYHKFGHYKNYKGFTDNYRPSLHGELSCIIRMGLEDLSDFTFINCRINNNDEVAMSKCCLNCERILRQVGVKDFYYTTNEGTFEKMILN